MKASAWSLTIGAATGAAATAVAIGVVVLIGLVTGQRLSALEQLIGMAYDDGPPWLGPAVGVGMIVAGGATGAWAVAGGEYGYVPRSLQGVVALVALYLGWTTLWTTGRLGSELSTAPFVPFYVALLTLVGLLWPLVLLFIPTALLWARVVERLLVTTAPRGERARLPR